MLNSRLSRVFLGIAGLALTSPAGAVDLSLAGGNPNKLDVLGYLNALEHGDHAAAMKNFTAPGFLNHREKGMWPTSAHHIDAPRPAGAAMPRRGPPPGGGDPAETGPLQVQLILADGPYVVVHFFTPRTAGQTISWYGHTSLSEGQSVVNIFRMENGKIAEKWDVIETVGNKTVY